MVAMVGARSGSPNDDPATLPYRNVLHELLVALLGRSGEVFVEEAPGHRGPEGGEAAGGVANPGRCGLRLAEDISWVEGPDRAVLDEVVTLGFHFRELDAWARRERDPGVGPRELKSVQGSAYRRAMAAGVEEVLEVYSSAVLRLEQQLLAPGPGRPALALLQRFAAEFRPILGPLHHLVHRAMADNTRGKQLISELHKRAGCGVPALAACIERLLWHANQVLFRQLSAWMVHGLLQDHHGEFFIQRLDDAEEEGLGDEDRPKPEVEKIQATSDDSRLDPDHTLLVEWHRGFQVSMDRTPVGISIPVAADILFIGKAVRVLRKPGGAFRRQELLPAEDMLAATEALSRLQDQPFFSRVEFERVVEQIRLRVAGRLWRLLVVDSELPLHLRALKDYFLLTRGDFWQCFLVESRQLLLQPPRKMSDNDINIPFQQSALKSSAGDDKLFGNLCPMINKEKLEESKAHVNKAPPPETTVGGIIAVPRYSDGWDYLCLDFKVSWPLGIMLTPEVLEMYNILFRYLLRLKRVELSLQEAWSNMKAARWTGPERMPLWHLRQFMAYVFNNIQMYYQMDVIEVQHAALLDYISNAQDFKEAQRAHNNFLLALIGHSFLDLPTFTRHLEAMMGSTKTLCAWVYQGAVLKEESMCDVPREVEKLTINFKSKLSLLYKTLEASKGRHQSQAPAVRQLLIRLNYNSCADGLL